MTPLNSRRVPPAGVFFPTIFFKLPLYLSILRSTSRCLHPLLFILSSSLENLLFNPSALYQPALPCPILILFIPLLIIESLFPLYSSRDQGEPRGSVNFPIISYFVFLSIPFYRTVPLWPQEMLDRDALNHLFSMGPFCFFLSVLSFPPSLSRRDFCPLWTSPRPGFRGWKNFYTMVPPPSLFSPSLKVPPISSLVLNTLPYPFVCNSPCTLS